MFCVFIYIIRNALFNLGVIFYFFGFLFIAYFINILKPYNLLNYITFLCYYLNYQSIVLVVKIPFYLFHKL